MALVTPDRFHPRGEALAPGRPAVRVFGGIPGEAAEVVELGRGQHEVYARWVGAPRPSPDRVAPPCPHVVACGGCPWLHLSPEAARRWARARVVAALAGVEAEVGETVAGPDGEAGYRHLVKWVATDGGRRLGVHGRHGHAVVPIPGCRAAHPALRGYAEARFPAAAEVRHLVVRRSRWTGRRLAVVVAQADGPAVRRWADAVDAEGVVLHLNAREGDAIFDPRGPVIPLRGEATLDERAGAGVVTVGPLDFFQTNPGVAERIWASLPDPGPRLHDLYGGVGAVSVALGGAAEVTVVEAGPGAARAVGNLERNGRRGRVLAVPVGPGLGLARGATVVVNPPMRGLGEAGVAAVRELAPERLWYVACGPEALGRDLAALGVRVDRVTPYDLFPGTGHVETVVEARPPAGGWTPVAATTASHRA